MIHVETHICKDIKSVIETFVKLSVRFVDSPAISILRVATEGEWFGGMPSSCQFCVRAETRARACALCSILFFTRVNLTRASASNKDIPGFIYLPFCDTSSFSYGPLTILSSTHHRAKVFACPPLLASAGHHCWCSAFLSPCLSFTISASRKARTKASSIVGKQAVATKRGTR